MAEVEERIKMVHDNKTTMLAGIYTVYEKLKEENFAFIPLMLQDVAEDELEKFCKDDRVVEYCKDYGYNAYPNFRPKHGIFLVEWIEVRFDKGGNKVKFEVYGLNERWVKFRTFIV